MWPHWAEYSKWTRAHEGADRGLHCHGRNWGSLIPPALLDNLSHAKHGINSLMGTSPGTMAALQHVRVCRTWTPTNLRKTTRQLFKKPTNLDPTAIVIAKLRRCCETCKQAAARVSFDSSLGKLGKGHVPHYVV